VLRVSRLDGFFELVIGGDTLPHKKPHRSVLDHVARHFRISHDQLAHVGDSRTDVEAALNAGVSAWGVSWGYNAGEPIESAHPQRVFDRFSDVAGYVLSVTGGDSRDCLTGVSAILPL
jgi:phosphoglycolate phosphatase